MNRTVYTVTSGALAALARLDSVAQNLANVGTPGYKAERVLFRVRPLEEGTAAVAPSDVARTAAQVAEVATVRDFSQGPVRQSGNPLDVALTGPGFFVVSTPRGERYTRQGTFTLDAEGHLVTQAGLRVQGDGGDLQLPDNGVAAVGGDGTITVNGSQVGRIKVVDFGEKPALVAEGHALFAPAPGAVAAPLDAAAVRLEPGAIEAANIDAVTGLVELIEVSRGFEAYMQAMSRLDQVAERSITDVGRVG
jgi:flagellar basal-body rod protein FlgG